MGHVETYSKIFGKIGPFQVAGKNWDLDICWFEFVRFRLGEVWIILQPSKNASPKKNPQTNQIKDSIQNLENPSQKNPYI